MAMHTKVFIGQKYGRLIVVDRVGSDKYSQPLWLCECECGNTIILPSPRLLRGNTKSCGCLRRETSSQVNKKHGMKGTRLYDVWKNMRKRCYQPQNPGYKHYGGRGIIICDEWAHFKAFYEWAMANGYDETAPRGECTIDRIDVNGNYCPANCRWITIGEQQLNKRNSKNRKVCD